MVKKAMKIRLVLMMVVVFAILPHQAMVQVENPSFFYDHYLNHPPSLTPFLHSLPSISLSPYNDAKPRRHRSRKRNRPNEKQSPGSVNTPTKEEEQARFLKFEEAKITCRKECAMKSRENIKSSAFLLPPRPFMGNRRFPGGSWGIIVRLPSSVHHEIQNIDISCMGQNLLDTQTLKQVRDAVWLPRLLESVDSTMSFEDSYDGSTQHLMSLHYSRPCELEIYIYIYIYDKVY
ncbi:uncharacterized protein LOC133867206 [Alnus glutinosa]|uniref:uncharacterized protein LOC133867206 n=1 Tax=Alnus glutinosa TaxID=3517 RepID=UPI002D764C40|nr:uncharacterized protein LOC133867206 [Alnus glutinosa]